jgi:hypothetical protein
MLDHLLFVYEFNLKHIRYLVEDLTPEQCVHQPSGLINHPAWQVGHLALAANIAAACGPVPDGDASPAILQSRGFSHLHYDGARGGSRRADRVLASGDGNSTRRSLIVFRARHHRSDAGPENRPHDDHLAVD